MLLSARAPVLLLVVLACMGSLAPAARAESRAGVAALQVALRATGVYAGTVDGIAGPGTVAGVRALQRRHGLRVDGVAGRRTLRALGDRWRHRYGSRPLRLGQRGLDVAALQFKLAKRGFPSGNIDGSLGGRSIRALQRFQSWAGLSADGVGGRATLRALRAPPRRSPVGLRRPIAAATGDRFGPRGNRLHSGVDFPAATGTRVAAAGFGRVAFSGYASGGWGKLVIIEHRFGLRTMYAHLSATSVSTGTRVAAGQRIGSVGATGGATGPHLHFELRLRGASIDPLSAL
ncbi:MAG: peptidoglycan DD-metalloendopeptidase family protein [Solirubrobacteraceae bacterium]